MYIVEKKTSHYDEYILKDTEAGTSAVVTPAKGGVLSGLCKNGLEYIYVNDDNYYSEERPRCAMPVLFPACGRTKEETYYLNGKAYKMGIHGIAHLCKWEKISESTEDGASVTIGLKADDYTKQFYPFDFEIKYTYLLKGGVLSVLQEYINHGEDEMPFSFGFHPYFKVSDVHNIKFDIDAGKIIPPQTNIIEPYKGIIDFPYGTTDSVVLSEAKNYAAFIDKSDNREVKVTFDENFTHVVLWSGAQDKYICVEPWSALPDSLNTGDTHKLQSKATLKAKIAIEI